MQHVEGLMLKAAVAWSRALVPVPALTILVIELLVSHFLRRLLSMQADANRPL